MTHRLRRAFSWSVARWALYERCPLEYYYHYYASWGGWEPDADERTLRLYAMKKSLPLETVAFEAVLDALDDALSKAAVSAKGRGIELDFKSITRSAVLTARGTLEEFPPIEVRSGSISNEDARRVAAETARRLSAEAADSPLTDILAETAPLDIIRHTTPASFRMEGIEIWTNPLLLFRGKRGISVLSVAPPETPLERLYMRNAVNAAFAAETAGTAGTTDSRDAVETLSIVLEPPDTTTVRERLSTGALRKILRRSVDAMLSHTKLDTDIREESFPPTENPDACSACRFLQECRFAR